MPKKSAKGRSKKKTATASRGSNAKPAGSLRRAATSVARAVKRAVSGVIDRGSEKLHKAAATAAERDDASKARRGATGKKKDRRAQPQPRRVARTSSPVPDKDVRTPSQTSSHGPFDQRSERDPDKIPGGEKVLNEQFKEEDTYTNKSKDPRIGTHGRTYTP